VGDHPQLGFSYHFMDAVILGQGYPENCDGANAEEGVSSPM